MHGAEELRRKIPEKRPERTGKGREEDDMEEQKVKFDVRSLNLFYGEFQALKQINMQIKEHEITALIGPSGCGKSTFLKTLNRMNDFVTGAKVEGEIRMDERTSTGTWTGLNLGTRWAWFSSSPIHFRKVCMTMWRTDHGFLESGKNPGWMRC